MATLTEKLLKKVDEINELSHLIKARLRKLKNGRYSIYLDKHINKKREYEPLSLILYCHSEFKQDDEETLEKLKNIIKTKEKEHLDKKHKKTGELIDEVYLIPWFEDYATRAGKNKTADVVTKYMKLFLKTINREKMLFSDVDYTFCDQFADYIKKQSHLMVNTKHGYFRMFKLMLNEAVARNIIERNPAKPIKFPTEETDPDYFTPEEVQMLIDTPTNYVDMKNAALFSIFTGLRISDIYKLRFSMRSGNIMNVRQTKTGSIVRVVITQDVERILEEQRNRHEGDIVFPMHQYDAANKQFKQWVTEAGISPIGRRISFHSTRHTAAMLMIDHMPIQFISKILGHKTIVSTMRYQNIKNEKISEALQAMPSFLTDKK